MHILRSSSSVEMHIATYTRHAKNTFVALFCQDILFHITSLNN